MNAVMAAAAALPCPQCGCRADEHHRRGGCSLRDGCRNGHTPFCRLSREDVERCHNLARATETHHAA